MSIPPVSPLAYEGSIAIPFIMRNFAPNSTNNVFGVPTIWIDPTHSMAYLLLGKSLGVADWVPIASGNGEVDMIITPDGTTVLPSAGVINFLNGTGISITGSSNNITFNSVGGGLQWVNVSGTSQALSAGHAYVANNSALVTFTLPATADFGDFFVISGLGSGGWTISQNAGQQVILGDHTSTSGVGGSIASTLRSDSIQIVCVTANTTFKAFDWAGNLTVV